MAETTRKVLAGVANGININVELLHPPHGSLKYVTLSQNYARALPPGFPYAPAFTGAARASLDFPRTIASGTRLQLLGAEADALVAAGVAAYS
jgi:hypothetical protein